MRRHTRLRFALLCAAVLAAGQTAAAQPPAPDSPWRTFQPPSKLFTAQFPGVPTHESRVLDQGIEKKTAHRYWYGQPGRGGAYFEVIHIAAPPNDRNLPFGIILDATIDTVMNQQRALGVRETGRREVVLNGCVGREFEASSADGRTVRGRLFVAAGHIINAVHVGPSEPAARQWEARRFLDSVMPAEACAPQPAEPPAAVVKKLGRLTGPRDAASGWMLINPAQSGFSALVPGPAEAEEEMAQQKPYPLVLRTYTAEQAESTYVLVECGDFPAEMNRVANFEEMKFNLVYRGLAAEAEKLGVQVISDGDVNVGGHRGQRYRLSSPLLSARAVIVSTPKKIYMFGAFAAGPKPPEADFNRFFSSLKIAAP